MENELLTQQETSKYTKRSVSSLQRDRVKGIGIRYVKAGEGKNSKILYPKAEIDKWIESQLVETC